MTTPKQLRQTADRYEQEARSLREQDRMSRSSSGGDDFPMSIAIVFWVVVILSALGTCSG